MKIFHIELAKTGKGLSGGEKCMVEIIKYFRDNFLENIIVTTDNGKKLYEELGLVEGKLIRYIIVNSEYTEKKYHIFLSYVIRLFLFKKIKNEIVNFIDTKEDVLMCHSEFFPNSIATYILSKHFRKKVIYWFHMQAPNIFRGYSGHFTKRFYFPELRIIHYKLNQIIYRFISINGLIITVNPYYESLFKRKNHYTLKKFGGDNLYIIKKYSGIETGVVSTELNLNKYDIAFIGRFHTQKGINEIPEILRRLKLNKKDIKLLMIGGGDKKIENAFFSKIKEYELTDNVDYKGYISSDEKFDYLRQAKVFIFPSYYESFGQVALEAMSNGLPVVAYDLPIFSVFERGMIKVPILNNEVFAKEIERLLIDKSYYDKISLEAINYAKTFSWSKTGEEVLGVINEL